MAMSKPIFRARFHRDGVCRFSAGMDFANTARYIVKIEIVVMYTVNFRTVL